MVDREIEQEIEANNQRKEAREAANDDNDTLIDVAEEAFTPITDAIDRSVRDDDEERELAERRRQENDQSQSPE